MSVEEATFVDIIQKFPHLWDKKDPLHRDKIATENAWRTISDIMKYSGKFVSEGI